MSEENPGVGQLVEQLKDARKEILGEVRIVSKKIDSNSIAIARVEEKQDGFANRMDRYENRTDHEIRRLWDAVRVQLVKASALGGVTGLIAGAVLRFLPGG